MSLLGNELDQAVRNCNDAQTNGIPIGPDPSLLIAEIVLTAIDLELAQRHPELRLVRKMDDYEVPVPSESAAQEVQRSLEEVLADYELHLNPDKTQIHEMPFALLEPWLRRLRPYALRVPAKVQRQNLVDLFDEAFEIKRSNQNCNVIYYVLGTLRGVNPENWDVLQNLVAQAVNCEPGALRQASALFDDMADIGLRPEPVLLSDVINQTVVRQAPLGHASEVAWALRLAIHNGVRLDEDATTALYDLNDDVVACMSFDANKRKLLTNFVPPDRWLSPLNEDGLLGPHWLLAYETSIKGWVQSRSDYVAKNPAFAFLRENNVSFYGTSSATLNDIARSSSERKRRSRARRTVSIASSTSAKSFAASPKDQEWSERSPFFLDWY